MTSGNDQRLDLGEGPVWDSVRHQLWWVDSEAGQVFRGDLTDDALVVDRMWDFGEKVGSVTPADDGGFLVAVERQVLVMNAAGARVDAIDVLPSGQSSRLNDGACDPVGRFLVGSIRLDDRQAQECLWAVEPDRTVRRVVEGITVSNGIGFSPDASTMYYVDTRPGVLLAFDYDSGSGRAANRRVVSDCGGTPDGLAVDRDGNVWVAFFGEGEVRCYSPLGEVVDRIRVAVPNVTCPEFVGPDLDRLVITTACFRMSDADRAATPEAGAVFVTDMPVAGQPMRGWAGSTS